MSVSPDRSVSEASELALSALPIDEVACALATVNLSSLSSASGSLWRLTGCIESGSKRLRDEESLLDSWQRLVSDLLTVSSKQHVSLTNATCHRYNSELGNIHRICHEKVVKRIVTEVSQMAEQRAHRLNPNGAAFVVATSRLEAQEDVLRKMEDFIAQLISIVSKDVLSEVEKSCALRIDNANLKAHLSLQYANSRAANVALSAAHLQLQALQNMLTELSTETDNLQSLQSELRTLKSINRQLESHMTTRDVVLALQTPDGNQTRTHPSTNQDMAPELFAIRFLESQNWSLSELISNWIALRNEMKEKDTHISNLETQLSGAVTEMSISLSALRGERSRRLDTERMLSEALHDRVAPDSHVFKELGAVLGALSRAKDDIARLQVLNAELTLEKKSTGDLYERTSIELDNLKEQMKKSSVVQQLARSQISFHEHIEQLNAQLLDSECRYAAAMETSTTVDMKNHEISEQLAALEQQMKTFFEFNEETARDANSAELRHRDRDVECVRLQEEVSRLRSRVSNVLKLRTDRDPQNVLSSIDVAAKSIQGLSNTKTHVSVSLAQTPANHLPSESSIAASCANSLAEGLMKHARSVDGAHEAIIDQLQDGQEILNAFSKLRLENEGLLEQVRRYEALIESQSLEVAEAVLQDPNTCAAALALVRGEQNVDEESSLNFRVEEVSALRAEINSLREINTSQRDSIHKLNRDLCSAREALASQIDTVNTLERQISHSDTENASLRSDRRSLNVLRGSILRLHAALAVCDEAADVPEQEELFSSNISQVICDLTSIVESAVREGATVTSLDDVCDPAEVVRAAQHDVLERLRATLDDVHDGIAQVPTINVATSTSELEAANKKIEDMVVEISTLKEEVRRRNSSTESLIEKYKSLRRESEENVQSAEKRCQMERESADSKLKEAASQIHELRTQVQNLLQQTQQKAAQPQQQQHQQHQHHPPQPHQQQAPLRHSQPQPTSFAATVPSQQQRQVLSPFSTQQAPQAPVPNQLFSANTGSRNTSQFAAARAASTPGPPGPTTTGNPFATHKQSQNNPFVK